MTRLCVAFFSESLFFFKVILQFIVDNGRCEDIGGIALWQLMEERQVVERRSWQSMKERFRRSILKRLDSFDLSEEQKQQLRQGGKGVKGKGGRSRSGSNLASDD